MENKTILEVKNLAKTYRGKDGTETKALRGISFSVTKGSIFGIIGANGAGKSTTIDCVLGVKKPDAGTNTLTRHLVNNEEKTNCQITILGNDLLHLSNKQKSALFDRIGVQFQDSRFQDKFRVSEICKLTSAFYTKPADWKTLLTEFGLLSVENKYINDLSGGQRQKLAVILALLPQPEVVFLDELTTGLDPASRRTMWNHLKKLQNKGLTIILTSHYMEEVEYLCDHLVILKEGLIATEGTPTELMQSHNVKNLEELFLQYFQNQEETDD